MSSTTDRNEREGAKNANVSLFPRHIAVVRAFASDDNRSYSNAAQTIIEQWAREHGYGRLLLEEELAA